MINEKLESKFRTNIAHAAVSDYFHDANYFHWYHLNSIAGEVSNYWTPSLKKAENILRLLYDRYGEKHTKEWLFLQMPALYKNIFVHLWKGVGGDPGQQNRKGSSRLRLASDGIFRHSDWYVPVANASSKPLVADDVLQIEVNLRKGSQSLLAVFVWMNSSSNGLPDTLRDLLWNAMVCLCKPNFKNQAGVMTAARRFGCMRFSFHTNRNCFISKLIWFTTTWHCMAILVFLTSS